MPISPDAILQHLLSIQLCSLNFGGMIAFHQMIINWNVLKCLYIQFEDQNMLILIGL